MVQQGTEFRVFFEASKPLILIYYIYYIYIRYTRSALDSTSKMDSQQIASKRDPRAMVAVHQSLQHCKSLWRLDYDFRKGSVKKSCTNDKCVCIGTKKVHIPYTAWKPLSVWIFKIWMFGRMPPRVCTGPLQKPYYYLKYCNRIRVFASKLSKKKKQKKKEKKRWTTGTIVGDRRRPGTCQSLPILRDADLQQWNIFDCEAFKHYSHVTRWARQPTPPMNKH